MATVVDDNVLRRSDLMLVEVVRSWLWVFFLRCHRCQGREGSQHGWLWVFFYVGSVAARRRCSSGQWLLDDDARQSRVGDGGVSTRVRNEDIHPS